jgi:hypothetical protein
VPIAGKSLSLKFGATMVEVNCSTTQVALDNEGADADLTTFADVIAGTDRRWFLTLTGIPDYVTPGSFWLLLWDLPAFSPIGYHLSPYGAGLGLPTFEGEATLDQPPPIGGAAGSNWTFETRLTCTARPYRAVAAA